MRSQPQHQHYYYSLASADPLKYFSLLTVGCLIPDTFTPLECLESLGLRSDKPPRGGAMLIVSTRDWQVYRAALSAWAAAIRLWGKEVGAMGGAVARAHAAGGGGGDGGSSSSSMNTNAVMALLLAPQMRLIKSIVKDMQECEQTMGIAIATGSAVDPLLPLCVQFQLLQLVWVVRGLLLMIKVELQVAGKWVVCASEDNSSRIGGPSGGSSRAADGSSRGKCKAAAAANVTSTSSSSTELGGGSGREEFQQQQQQQQQGQPGIMHQAKCLLELDSSVVDMMNIVMSMLWESGGSRVVVEGAQEVEALLRAQDSNTLHHAPPVAPSGTAAAFIMQVALREAAARGKEVEGGGKEGGKEGNTSASMLAASSVGGAREHTAGGGDSSQGIAVVAYGPAAAERPEVAAAAAGGGAGTGYDADAFKLLQMLARPDLAAAAIAAVPAAAATDPVAFCSSIVSRVRAIRLLPQAVVDALESVAALQEKGEGQDSDVKEARAGSSSSSNAGGVSAAEAADTAAAAALAAAAAADTAAADEERGGPEGVSSGVEVSGVVPQGHQAGGGCRGEGESSAEGTSMDHRDCDETQQEIVVAADDRKVLVTAAMIELLHVFVAEVPLPVGCNNPHCPAAVDEAVATRKCTGCKLAVYCSDGCLKEHWKEHKGVCRRVQAARKDG